MGDLDDDRIAPRAWLVLTVVSLCTVQSPLSQSILNVGFPRLLAAFPDTTSATLSWVLSGYAITAAAMLVIAGVIADRYGHKRIVLIGGIGFGTMSLACGFSRDVGFLVACRMLQAVFGALLTPAGASLVLREFPVTRRATAIAAWAASGSVASAVGPTLGALLVDRGGWRWTFWVNVPFVVIGVVAIAFVVRETELEERPFPDLWSVPLVMASVSGIVLGVSQSARWGWDDRRTIASIVVGVVLGAYLLLRSARHPRPLVDLSLFRFGPFRLANLASITFGTTFFAVFLGFPRFTQEVWGYQVRKAGLLLLPIPIAGILFNGLAGKIADRRGHRGVMITGGALQCAGGLVLWFGIDSRPDVLTWLIALSLVGLGTSFIWPAIFGNTVLGVPPDRFGEVTAINQTAQRMANAAGTAVAVSLVGEVAVAGVGNYGRLFLLTAFGGVVAMVLGGFMRGVRAAQAAPVVR